jgi:plastocyanin/predicted phosphodiesterase
MKMTMERRQFLTASLAGLGGIVFASDLIRGKRAQAAGRRGEDFFFVQFSDTHWGFKNPAINPDFGGTLPKAIAAVNAWPKKPDLVVFTGDLTHTTDDDKERRARLAGFRELSQGLKVETIKYLPGEHDAALDRGAAYRDLFGPSYYVFDHKGVHFIVLDNVSDPAAHLGDEQLGWLAADLKKQNHAARIVVLTHRPLFDLAPDWDWATPDGSKAIDLLMPYQNVTVLYGHIHQVNHHQSGHIGHHAATGMMYPLPAPHSVPKKGPIPWDPAHPYQGLGYRQAEARVRQADLALTELPVVKAADPPAKEQVVKVTAKKFEYSPSVITLKRGVPATLQLTSLDRQHGFACPALKLQAEINPGKVTEVKFTPDKVGEFPFHCSVFCGSGHDQMEGTIKVTE